MIEVLASVLLFTAIVMCLVFVVLLARTFLLPGGEVEITINEKRTIRAPREEKLLGALHADGILVPSACGGKGTCAQCKVAVLSGAGPPLPVETARLARRELAEGVRLACQVAIRDDLDVRVPEEIFGVRQLTCRVRSSRCVATLIKEIVLELPEGELLDFRAGAYVQVTSPPYRARFSDFAIDPEVRDEWDRLDLWRYEAGCDRSTTRAYSLANPPAESDRIVLDVRIATPPPGAPQGTPPGIVSSYLFSLRPGDEVAVSGAYGHFFASEGEREMVFVGGGAGMAPMRSLILDQLERLHSRRTITFWYGARSRRELFYAELFDALAAEHPNFRWCVALSEPRPEDAWGGETGFIHEVLYAKYLEGHPAPEDCEYYLCGPPLMIRAVRSLLDGLGVEPEAVHFDDFGG